MIKLTFKEAENENHENPLVIFARRPYLFDSDYFIEHVSGSEENEREVTKYFEREKNNQDSKEKGISFIINDEFFNEETHLYISPDSSYKYIFYIHSELSPSFKDFANCEWHLFGKVFAFLR